MLFGTRRSLLGGPLTYADKVRGIASNNLIAYWPLWERVGTVADNYQGDAALDGAYTGVALADSTFSNGDPVGLWDGANDYCNIYSASLNTAWNGAEGTAAIWIRVVGGAVWTDGVARWPLQIGVDASNRVNITKGSASNQLVGEYRAGGTNDIVIASSITTAGWLHVALTWSKSADQLKFYIAGAQSGVTQTGLGTWAGSLATTTCAIGAQTTGPVAVWSGYLAHCAIWTTPLSAAQVLALATV